jgi:hypothetical protein
VKFTKPPITSSTKRLWVIGTVVLVVILSAVMCVLVLLKTPDAMSITLQKMARYGKDRKYDKAIAVGQSWLARNPVNGTNDQVLGLISILYLEKAKKNDGHEDDYVNEAIAYRDKMLRVATDGPFG